MLFKKSGGKVKLAGTIGIDNVPELLGRTEPVLSGTDSKLYQKETDQIVSLVGLLQELIATEVKKRFMKMEIRVKVGIII